MRAYTLRAVTAGIIGAITGLILYTIIRTSGRNLFVITGAVAGVVAVLVQQLSGRAAHLTEVKVNVPHISQLTFVVNNDSRQVAWQLFVETVTRVSTQPLEEGEGVVREALTSLYGLFATTREILKATRPSTSVTAGRTVEQFAVAMLNQELRPFLSKWHPALSRFELEHPGEAEASWPGNAACRQELRIVQSRIYDYAIGFAQLAGILDVHSLIGNLRPRAAPG
jgi:hypothetical protein